MKILEQMPTKLVLLEQSATSLLAGVAFSIVFCIFTYTIAYHSPTAATVTCQKTSNVQNQCELTESFILPPNEIKVPLGSLITATEFRRHNNILLKTSDRSISFPSRSFYIQLNFTESKQIVEQVKAFTNPNSQQQFLKFQSRDVNYFGWLMTGGAFLLGLEAIKRTISTSVFNTYIFARTLNRFTTVRKSLFGQSQTLEYPLQKISEIEIVEQKTKNGSYFVVLKLLEEALPHQYELEYFSDRTQAEKLTDRIRGFIK